jgi:hypothetical protein
MFADTLYSRDSDESVIRDYIRKQDTEDRRLGQLWMMRPLATFRWVLAARERPPTQPFWN